MAFDGRYGASRPFSSFESEGVENGSLLYSSDEADDFSELGPPMGLGAVTIPKLMTEKPDIFKKSTTMSKPNSSSHSGSRSPKAVVLKSNTSFLGLPHKSENITDISKPDIVNKKAVEFRSSKSVTIENVPSVINLSMLTKEMSTFGTIAKASMRTVQKGLDCCDIEFESVESRNEAVSVGKIAVENFDFQIRPPPAQDIVTIRIQNISLETTDSTIHSMCTSCGLLEGLVRKNEDTVDALFYVKENLDNESILEKLNNTVMDDCKWSAHVQRVSTHSLMTTDNDDDAQLQLALKVSSHIDDLKRQITDVQVLAEDLERLHDALMHLQRNPATSGKISDVYSNS